MMQPPDPRRAFRERLATYLIGVAIGCILLGFMWMARYQAAQRAQSVPGQSAPTTAPPTSSAPTAR